MEVHQGAIGVRSEGAGLGSSFFIDIPVRRIDRSSSLPRSRQASSSNGSPAQSSKYISRPSPSPSPSSKNIFKYSPSPPDAMNSISVRSMSEKGTIKEISQESKLTSVQLNLLADPNTVAPAPAPVTNTSLETNNATAVDPIPSATMPEPGASIGIEAATPVSIPTIAAVETPTVPSAIRATVPIGPVAAPISPTSPAVTTPTSVVVMPLKKVLIVDDVAVNRKMLRKIMEKRAQSIEEAADGNEAVDKSMVYLPDNPNPYDVVMMDFVMPKMNGPEATRQMRALGYTGLIVGVTGNSLQADIDFFMESGADEVFIKPLNVEKFVNYLKEKLNMPDLR